MNKIKVNDKITLVLKKMKFKNNDEIRMDVRVFVKTKRYEGPTKSGFNIPISSVNDLIEGLKKEMNNLQVEVIDNGKEK